MSEIGDITVVVVVVAVVENTFLVLVDEDDDVIIGRGIRHTSHFLRRFEFSNVHAWHCHFDTTLCFGSFFEEEDVGEEEDVDCEDNNDSWLLRFLLRNLVNDCDADDNCEWSIAFEVTNFSWQA